MTPREILIRARKRIEKPEYWTQGSMARCETGQPVHPSFRKATCWCALGALSAGITLDDYSAYCTANVILSSIVGTWGIPAFNDTHTHADILAAFDMAIRVAS